MSHYPSSAELAAFRRGCVTLLTNRALTAPMMGGAYAFEKVDGLGRNPRPTHHTAGEARRGAAAMRARAFHDLIFGPGWTSDMIHPQAVQCDGTVAPGQRGYVAAWIEELAHGCPAWGKE